MLRQQTRWTARREVSCAAAVALVVLAPAAWVSVPERAQAATTAEAVLDWNRYAMEALVNRPDAATPGAGQPPPVSIQHLAMVQGAVYDAVNLIDGDHQPYLTGRTPKSPSASEAAAVATAAHGVLVGMRPALPASVVTRLDGLRDQSLAAARAEEKDKAVQRGVAVGQAAAAAMLEARADDGRYGAFRFATGTAPGAWRPTGPVNDPNAWVAKVTPFALSSPSQFRTQGPPALTSDAYAAEYLEVKNLGGKPTAASPTLRTAEQTDLGMLYSANPVEMFSRMFRELPATRQLSVMEQARLFALLNVSGADALIGCWDDKAHWGFWRPVTAINHGDSDGNDQTAGDASWAPLLDTPPYPDHPSGYNCVTAALMQTATAFFGADPMPFRISAGGRARDYQAFRDVVEDAIDARIYLGYHFRSADEQGAQLGRSVAEWVAQHYFQRRKG